MNYRTAEALVERTHYKPDWSFSTRRAYTGDNVIEITVDALVDNSSLPPTYNRRIWAGSTFQIDLNKIDTVAQFMRAFADNLLRIEEHELREFLRCENSKGEWVAPFHPHRPEGEFLWDSTSGQGMTPVPLPAFA